MTYGKAQAAKEESFKPTGTWQTYEIQAVGPRVTVRVNGVLVTEAEVGRVSGHIGLQGETAVVEYRNISVREFIAP